MLRTRLSSSALRARAQASLQSTAILPPVPATPARYARISQRGLASAVLLSSRENWQSKTVKNLKEALAQRSLPVSGPKKVLVSRLEEYESQSNLSSATSSAYARNTSATANARHLSSSAVHNAEASNPASDTDPADSATPKVQVLTDAEVNIQNVAKVEEADPSTVPGVPEEKAQIIEPEQPAYIGAVNMPAYEEVEEQLAIPPFLPDNYAAKAENSMAPPTPDPDADNTPKVISISADAVENARHSLHETVTNLSSDVSEKAEEVVEDVKEAADNASKDFPPLSEVLSSVQIPSVPLGYITSGLKMPALKGGEEFKGVDRPLNSEERKGAYLLFGIVVGGLLLGGGKKKHEENEEHESEKKDEEKKH
ncbi:hypothetical protein QFC24_001454 [Naganishia onofrii]|uniref:Uncharacterized protein n=1 Tax=Naganishia onofrii TaxID=1851511 RepID=A0ACC2XV00_9TREE|nr:hypothetical protein QFC24_001454 [Naganishia onofrii]